MRYRRNYRNYVWKVKVWFKLFFLFIEKLLELLRIHSSFLQNFKLKSFTKNDIIFWIVLTFDKYLKHLNINTSILNIWTLLLKYLLIHLSPTCLLLQLYSKRVSGTGAFLWFLRNFQENIRTTSSKFDQFEFWRAPDSVSNMLSL